MAGLLAVLFAVSLPGNGYAQFSRSSQLVLPSPGTMVPPTAGYAPAMIRGLIVHPENPLLIDFIIDTGHDKIRGERLKAESLKLIKYFYASLTIPDDQTWVNLSPAEKDKVIAKDLGKTEMGRDLLAQDYVLKQLTASLLYPEKELGKEFWQRVRAQAKAQFGTEDVPVDTFHKVWIIPSEAKVYQNGAKAFVLKSHLKVMMERDYLLSKTQDPVSEKEQGIPSPELAVRQARGEFEEKVIQIYRAIIIPAIEKEVNAGQNFANLRQIFNSMILATWYKINLKETLLGKVYVDQAKTKGINLNDPTVKDKIYQQYLSAFKQGVFDYTKEETDPVTEETVSRQYFSGGFLADGLPDLVAHSSPVTPAERADFFAGGEVKIVRSLAVENPTSIRPEAGILEEVRPGIVTPKLPWAVGGLWAGEKLKEHIEAGLAKTPVNPWRLQASLAAVPADQWQALVKSLVVKHTEDPGRVAHFLREQRMKGDFQRVTYYSPVMSLEEELRDAERDLVHFDNRKYTDDQVWIRQNWELWRNVLKIAAEYSLGAHGTLNAYQQYKGDAFVPFNLHWAMLGIMESGQIRFGELGVLRPVNLATQRDENAAQFGPYYILFAKEKFGRIPSEHKETQESDHLIYLVPEEKARAFFELGLRRARAHGFITAEYEATVRAKIMTYQEFVNADNAISLIKEGKISPAEAIGNQTSSPDVSDNQYGGINLDRKLWDLQILRDNNGVPLPVGRQPIGRMRIDGFTPVILAIKAAPSLPALLGLAQ
ncbi:MAG: hypothetical protein HQL23_03475 [Candidatus Omnitrophica bacterium]|nr:hypothetical protein [Candidatus Omnitrophota bacterium]